jgi:hypothetical protein
VAEWRHIDHPVTVDGYGVALVREGDFNIAIVWVSHPNDGIQRIWIDGIVER